MQILCGIVTYNPNIKRLKENIDNIFFQVEDVCIVDNGSRNIDEIENLIKKYKNISLLKLNVNFGIAYALKKIMEYGNNNNYDWVLTLDQDSVANSNLISTYMKYIDIENLGMLTCNIVDRNFVENNKSSKEYEDVRQCITSGALMNTTAYKDVVGGV